MRTLATKPTLAATAIIAAALLLAPITTCAQNPAKPLAFDVASIRKNVGNIGQCNPTQFEPTARGFHMTNCPIIVAIGAAYVPTTGEALGYLVEDRIVGLPDWVQQERYDIDARIADSDAQAWSDPTRRKEMMHAMMQTLLTQRCKLTAHREIKDKPIYALVLGKNGSRLKPSEASRSEAARASHPDAQAIPGGSGFFIRAQSGIDIYDASVGTLTLLLSGPAGRPIVDKTGLTGKYDIHLDFGQPGPPAADGTRDPGPSIFSVVQDQLGLKLDPQKDQVETLVIDHIERPTEN